MPVSTIDGTIETLKVRRKTKKITIFDTIVIRQNDGQPATIKKMVVAEPVAGALAEGLAGRFYTFAAFDLKGIHGLRAADGRSLFALPSNNETIMAFVAVISVAVFCFWFFMEDRIAFLPAGLIVLGAVGYVFYRKGRIDAARQFAAENGAGGAA